MFLTSGAHGVFFAVRSWNFAHTFRALTPRGRMDGGDATSFFSPAGFLGTFRFFSTAVAVLGPQVSSEQLKNLQPPPYPPFARTGREGVCGVSGFISKNSVNFRAFVGKIVYSNVRYYEKKRFLAMESTFIAFFA